MKNIYLNGLSICVLSALVGLENACDYIFSAPKFILLCEFVVKDF